MNETINEIINMLINKICDLEKTLDEIKKEKRMILDYLIEHNIMLIYHSEKITSKLDEKVSDDNE